MKIHRETLDGDRPSYHTSEKAEINVGGIIVEFVFVDYKDIHTDTQRYNVQKKQSVSKGHTHGDEELVQPLCLLQGAGLGEL